MSIKELPYSGWKKGKEVRVFLSRMKNVSCMQIRRFLMFQDMVRVLIETIQRWVKS